MGRRSDNLPYKRTFISCNYCKCKISRSNIQRHSQSCDGLRRNKLRLDKAITCWFCKKEYKENHLVFGLNHQQLCLYNPFRRYKNGMIGKKGANQYTYGAEVTVETRQKIRIGNLGKKHRPETLEKLRQFGGLKPGAGKGKKGRYKGYWCDSSWELAWVIYNLDHGIQFQRNQKQFSYEFEGKLRAYTPDFVLANGAFIEIKGYEIDRDRLKYRAVSNLLVIRSKEMQPILSYVIDKHGKNFTSLYGDIVQLAGPPPD